MPDLLCVCNLPARPQSQLVFKERLQWPYCFMLSVIDKMICMHSGGRTMTLPLRTSPCCSAQRQATSGSRLAGRKNLCFSIATMHSRPARGGPTSQVICLSTVEPSILAPHHIDTAAADCGWRRVLTGSHDLQPGYLNR